LLVAAAISGCASLPPGAGSKPTKESVPYAGYIAVNPISLPSDLFEEIRAAPTAAAPQPGSAQPGAAGEAGQSPNLRFLINNAARVSIQETSSSGEVKYIASGLSAKGSYYRATIDYIKYHSSSISIPVDRSQILPNNQPRKDGGDNPASGPSPGPEDTGAKVTLGVAVGVGLRAEASFFSNEANAKIADIVNIGASAQTNQISGTMAFQTMGIESKAISDALPIPSQLSASTVQNALQTMATVKANIYSQETKVVPQIVGIEIQSYPAGVTLTDVVRALHRQKDRIVEQVQQELNQRKLKFYSERDFRQSR
jgi:hypothetical protein